MEEINLGYKEEVYGCDHVEPEKEVKTYYPSFYVRNMKQRDGLDVGDEAVAKVYLKKISMRENEDSYECEYELHKMVVDTPDKKKKSFSEALDMEVGG